MLKSQIQQIATKFPKPIKSLSHRHYLHHNHQLFLSPCLFFAHAPLLLRHARPWPPVVPPAAAAEEEGPVELFPSTEPIFATDDEPTPIQTATSVLLTGAVAVFLFRSLRRRARRSKELRFRSSGAKKSLKEEALDSLKAMASSSPAEAKGPPSPVQALLGAISAGVIALILYKFTTTIEASLNRQTISDNFSVRQITITIRTIINGICYLATFVFGINSVGLFLYAGQLAINSIMEEPKGDKTQTKGEETSTLENPTSNSGDSSEENQSSDDPQ